MHVLASHVCPGSGCISSYGLEDMGVAPSGVPERGEGGGGAGPKLLCLFMI